ncbi:hypothetical protein [Croceivirga sp. JEA036]|uniref:hypothetical protein n=1 Tax=Croceivirga sp. JEA036 TaxID=2721162 RepID=UPI00143AAAC2|nr:hypothetical protein [Croceivirga sp. JEA036]NJB35326.1 hypothetical protein [Croceivirga sp. JEA036]
MVRIVGYREIENEEGTPFFLLELQGGIEMVLSQTTNRYYATAKRAFISSTFNESTCLALIGTEMEGKIVKEECEPYQYVIKETGEEITLAHRWVYLPEGAPEPQKQTKTPAEVLQADVSTFSSNGVHELA